MSWLDLEEGKNVWDSDVWYTEKGIDMYNDEKEPKYGFKRFKKWRKI